ncbi:unnamed protein product [Caenorhabditis auriculariae]|uniref:Uncharacterized protein n=1 Tax=Caenorhabditis auriculariae TaxID=2777116 RepID=A0A8S1I002_9PELO|nr:unnamed protein product [Caenorhabditis auriculariae]
MSEEVAILEDVEANNFSVNRAAKDFPSLANLESGLKSLDKNVVKGKVAASCEQLQTLLSALGAPENDNDDYSNDSLYSDTDRLDEDEIQKIKERDQKNFEFLLEIRKTVKEENKKERREKREKAKAEKLKNTESRKRQMIREASEKTPDKKMRMNSSESTSQKKQRIESKENTPEKKRESSPSELRAKVAKDIVFEKTDVEKSKEKKKTSPPKTSLDKWLTARKNESKEAERRKNQLTLPRKVQVEKKQKGEKTKKPVDDKISSPPKGEI